MLIEQIWNRYHLRGSPKQINEKSVDCVFFIIVTDQVERKDVDCDIWDKPNQVADQEYPKVSQNRFLVIVLFYNSLESSYNHYCRNGK
jgi:hypothetical protein